MQSLIISSDGHSEEKTLTKQYSLEEMQKIVGGWIEIVALDHPKWKYMVVNEEGKLDANPIVNMPATILYDNPFDVIVGDVVVVDYEIE